METSSARKAFRLLARRFILAALRLHHISASSPHRFTLLPPSSFLPYTEAPLLDPLPLVRGISTSLAFMPTMHIPALSLSLISASQTNISVVSQHAAVQPAR